ncbi:Chorismate synthase family protein [Candida albicans]|uniref:chorismate synthase n=1 Tax=Candida albicans TaxID=5476 RepID=A0A8H6BTZ2_CANAX|nr:Chorismate synthase family protein [Candida albicans]
MLSLPATKGFEFGSGFEGIKIPGSKHNDAFYYDENFGRLRTETNNSGVAFKSAATISQEQETATYDGKSGVLAARGRHDPSVTPRAVPIVEAMTALVLCDEYMIQQARTSTRLLVQDN